MISIIIPVYNEEITIRKVLEALPYGENLEVIISDGGSSDRTVEFSKQYPVRVIQSSKGRATQMNKGAEVSSGSVLLFLHADSWFEKDSLKTIDNCLNDGYIGGCLIQKIDSSRLVYRIIEMTGNIRAKILKIFYGDQAIFVRRDIFFRVGGFDNIPIFEDVVFSKKMRKEGKTIVLNKRVFVSPRRWEKKGIIKTTFIHWLLTLGFKLRVPFEKLKKIYTDIR